METVLRAHTIGLALAVLLSTGGARAEQHRGARMVWARGDGAAGCVGASGLEEDVKARLGWDPFTLPKEIEIEGAAWRTPSGYRANLAFRDRDGKAIGTRDLQSREKDCRSLGQAVAVAITVAIDPDASGVAPVAAEEVPPPSESDVPAPRPPARVRERFHARMTLGAGMAAGLVPGPSGAGSLRAGVVVGDIAEIGVGAWYLPETREDAYGFGLASGELRACVLPWGAKGLARFCGAALVGVFETYVHASELTPVDVGAFAWAGAEAGPVLSLGLGGPLRLELATGAIVPITRRQGFVRGGAAPVWEQSPLAVRAELGVAALF